MAAAVEAACVLRAPVDADERSGGGAPARIVVFEADDERVGRSILATGNGRCNFSNAAVDPGLYRNGAFVAATLDALGGLRHTGSGGLADSSAMAASGGLRLANRAAASAALVELGSAAKVGADDDPVHGFFADLGLMWREEAEGRLYPLANKASSVLDVLRSAAEALGVEFRCAHRAIRVDAPEHPGDRFHIRFADGSIEHAEAVVVAVGGRAAAHVALPAHLACGEMRPVLGPLRTDNRITRQLNNIRVRCAVALLRRDVEGARSEGCEPERLVARERGELLFRDYGVSGVAVFNLSRHALEGDELAIDFLPDVPEGDVAGFLAERARRMGRVLGEQPSAERLCDGLLLPRVAEAVLHEAGVHPQAVLGKREMARLGAQLKGLRLSVLGIGDERQCQVMRGGFPVGAFRAGTCEARDLPGLFVAGEALDVDAPCGGYNLHWAWASGIVAGGEVARRWFAEGCCLRRGAGGAGCGGRGKAVPRSADNSSEPADGAGLRNGARKARSGAGRAGDGPRPAAGHRHGGNGGGKRVGGHRGDDAPNGRTSRGRHSSRSKHKSR